MADRDDDLRVALPWPPLLPWQHDVAAALVASRDRWPHALLIHGPAGIGKPALALNLARSLLCATPRPDGLACGTCADCHYAIAGQHPDLFRLELEYFEDGEWKLASELVIDRVRALIAFAALTSHRGRAKIAVIAPADRMNASAANALLKTLEEPPPSTFLMLVTSMPGRLPPTIVSRCRKLAAPRPSHAEAIAWLEAQGVRNAAAALARAGGAPLAALAAASPELDAERAVWLDALGDPAHLNPVALAARIDEGPREARKAKWGLSLDWMIAWIVDLARVSAGGVPSRNADRAAALGQLARQVAPLPLLRYHRRLMEVEATFSHPLAPRLLAEALLIGYADLFPRRTS